MLPASINRIRCIWGRHTFTSRGGGEEIKQGGGTAQLKKTIIFIANLLIVAVVPTNKNTYQVVHVYLIQLILVIAFENKFSGAIISCANTFAVGVHDHGLCNKPPTITTLPSHKACLSWSHTDIHRQPT